MTTPFCFLVLSALSCTLACTAPPVGPGPESPTAEPEPAALELILLANGSILVGPLRYDPRRPDDTDALQEALGRAAERGDRLTITADQATPFFHIQELMEACTEHGLELHKLGLAPFCCVPASARGD